MVSQELRFSVESGHNVRGGAITHDVAITLAHDATVQPSTRDFPPATTTTCLVDKTKKRCGTTATKRKLLGQKRN
jgi:hypothetical protein